MTSREERRRILGLRGINPQLFQVTDDMLRKKLLPDDFKPFDSNIFKQMSQNYSVEPFKEHVCPTCMISIFGPKKLLLEHHKIHARKKELGENEIYQNNYHEYL